MVIAHQAELLFNCVLPGKYLVDFLTYLFGQPRHLFGQLSHLLGTVE